MTLPKTILVPTDFSTDARAALDYAVELAGKLDAKVHLLHAVSMLLFGGELGLSVSQTALDSVLADNRAALERLAAEYAGKVPFGPPQLEIGDAREMIEEAARGLGADLIVMGTHGRRGVRRLLLGSVAESVARVAPCPVLLVRSVEAR